MTTASRLDRESLCQFTVTCDLELEVAVTSAVSQFFKKVKVVVRVQDTNDHAPAFPEPTLDLRMREDVEVGHAVTLRPATDLDTPAFGVVGYSLSPEGGPFEIKMSDDGSLVSQDFFFF